MYICLLCYWRGKAKETAQQEEEKTAEHDSSDQKTKNQTADQREDASSQSCHHRSVRFLFPFRLMSLLFHCVEKYMVTQIQLV